MYTSFFSYFSNVESFNIKPIQVVNNEFAGEFFAQTLNTSQKLDNYGIKLQSILKGIINFSIILLFIILKLFYLKPKKTEI
jgi:hypothetical protein